MIHEIYEFKIYKNENGGLSIGGRFHFVHETDIIEDDSGEKGCYINGKFCQIRRPVEYVEGEKYKIVRE